jgi:hypothetical protein
MPGPDISGGTTTVATARIDAPNGCRGASDDHRCGSADVDAGYGRVEECDRVRERRREEVLERGGLGVWSGMVVVHVLSGTTSCSCWDLGSL